MKKGFTIIELIIYIGLFSMILVILTQIITSTLNVQLENQTVSSVEQDSRYILSRLNYDIPRATSIVIPTVFGTTGKQPELQIKIGGVTYRYYLNNGNLMLDYPTGTNTVQLNGYDSTVTGLFFTRYNSNPAAVPGISLDNIQVDFTLTSRSQSKSGAQSRSYTATYDLRCYSGC